jgi:uncharacterized Fe-S center protein
MKKADVIFSNLRAGYTTNMLDKVENLLKEAGIEKRIKKGDLVAIKVHFGELGNTSFIRPIYVRRVVELVKSLGGKPFITDTNTLYVGSRSDAASHLETALANGFSYACVNAPLIIADGLRGNSSIAVAIEGEHYKEVEIGSEIVNADCIIALTHFKGHEVAGFGGALKNLGMGAAAKAGKLAQHSSLSPKIKGKNCKACGQCMLWCAHGAIELISKTKTDKKATIDTDKCVGCGACIATCPTGAIQIQWTEGPKVLQEKMAEHAAGSMKGKEDKSLFVNFITQVSPACDCHNHTDAPIVADIGLAASTNPVALDQACVDMVNNAQGFQDSALTKNHAPGEDKIRGVYPNIDWTVQLDSAEKIGMGTRQYTLRKTD